MKSAAGIWRPLERPGTIILEEDFREGEDASSVVMVVEVDIEDEAGTMGIEEAGTVDVAGTMEIEEVDMVAVALDGAGDSGPLLGLTGEVEEGLGIRKGGTVPVVGVVSEAVVAVDVWGLGLGIRHGTFRWRTG